jgi:hypothetical protein
VYPEATAYRGPAVEIAHADQPKAALTAPRLESEASLHVILIVTDDGSPPLTRYQRVVLKVVP